MYKNKIILNEKAQTLLIDFFFACLIFMLIFFSANSAWDRELSQTRGRQENEQMQLKAFAITESLVKGTGSPENWEELSFGAVQQIGLASTNLSLDTAKVNRFKNLDVNYSAVKELFGVPQYDYFFDLNGTIDVNAGIVPPADAAKIVVRRIVEWQSSEATVSFTLYKVES